MLNKLLNYIRSVFIRNKKYNFDNESGGNFAPMDIGNLALESGGNLDKLSQKLPYQGATGPSASMPITSLTNSPVFGQAIISVTGTAVPLATGSVIATNGVVIYNASANTIGIGNVAVTNNFAGTGNADIVPAGSSRGYAVTNANLLYVNGTAGSVVSWSAT